VRVTLLGAWRWEKARLCDQAFVTLRQGRPVVASIRSAISYVSPICHNGVASRVGLPAQKNPPEQGEAARFPTGDAGPPAASAVPKKLGRRAAVDPRVRERVRSDVEV
jgi:hypothetical protein